MNKQAKQAGVRRMLIVTDNHYISAMLFHGFGLPAWSDLPAVQADPALRQAMTAMVNRAIARARTRGFNAFDVHEAFPVDFMRIDESAEIIRNADYFLLERKYRAVLFLRRRFPDLSRQPRLAMLKSMRLGKIPLTETALLALYFKSHGVGILNPEIQTGAMRFPADFTVNFDARLKLKSAAFYPGIIRAAPHAFTARAGNADQLLEFYRYAGLQIMNANLATCH